MTWPRPIPEEPEVHLFFLTQHKFRKTALLNSTLFHRQFIACHAQPTSSAGAFNLLKFALILKKKKKTWLDATADSVIGK